ncbi:MAG: PepSY-associated TM helix domain-containing protein [bacterium]|nr:PepSY-associated TM helix domain-containing protein [bacterium]
MFYRLVRTIHLYAALFLAAFVVMYAITGFIMYRSNWFPNNRKDTERQVVFQWKPLPDGEDKVVLNHLESMQAQVRKDVGLEGRYEFSRKEKDGQFALVYLRPGSEERVFFMPGADSVRVTLREYGFAQMMNRMHQFHGYKGGVLFWWWGFLLDVVSVAMIMFAVSGVYLWYTLKAQQRGLGWVLLGGSTLYAIGSIVYLMVRS